MHRTTDYTDELADKICCRLASGESLRSVCRDEEYPCLSTVFNWLREREGFLEQYARAKEESADALVEDMLDIADNQATQQLIIEGEPVYNKKGEPVMVADASSIAHARLRVDTRKWKASKLKPKKYGDSTQLKHTDGDGNPLADILGAVMSSTHELPSADTE